MTAVDVGGCAPPVHVTEPEVAALSRFTEYFVRNYPGPRTIICDPMWHAPRIFRAAKHALAQQEDAASFQAGVTAWMGECFLPSIVHDRTERGDRLLEEVLELLQAHGYDRRRVATLVDYVYGRPVGEPAQEVGGVMVTLAAYCMVAGLDMHAEGDRELARVTQPEVMAKIRRKQEAKNALHFDTPLPGNPQEVPRG